MAEATQTLQPSPVCGASPAPSMHDLEDAQEDDEQAPGSVQASLQEAGPDFSDEPPAEGRVNDPVPSVGPDTLGRASPAGHSGRQLTHVFQGAEASVAVQNAGDDVDAEAVAGLEDMMTDLSELIDLLPVENAVQESLPTYLQMLRQPKPTPLQGEQLMVPYDPASRPTSRWRCRWGQISPHDVDEGVEDRLSAFMPRDVLGERLDFRNPYIKALNSTREELQKSWDLMAEASPATRLATERHDALASMQVFEVDDFLQPEHNGLLCRMPEPCRETCREAPMTEMTEVRLCQYEFNGEFRHPGDDADYVAATSGQPTASGQPPRPARFEDMMMRNSGVHPGKGLVRQEGVVKTGDLSSREEFKYVREEI